MSTVSVWQGTAGVTSWQPLTGQIECEVAIVGAGITGVTVAWLLASQGRSVALLEAWRVGNGDTAGSTGNLYSPVSSGLHAVRAKWDATVARSVAESRAAAVDFIEQQCAGMESARFLRCDLWLYAGAADAEQSVRQEHEAAKDAGVPAQLASELPAGPPRPHGSVLQIRNQAQFHPLTYVQALAQKAAGLGARIFENSPVLEVEGGAGLVRTASGCVRARHVVLATHSPTGVHRVQMGLSAGREYGLAFGCPEGWPHGTFWAQGSNRLSLRSLETSTGKFLIAVGEQGPTGNHDEAQTLARLQHNAAHRLQLTKPAFRWSAQHFHSPDELPYIGQDASCCFIATGFGTDGLTYGTLAARIIGDEILGHPNSWAGLYRASRVDLLKSASGVLDVSKQALQSFAHDVLAKPQQTLEELPAGKGAIVQHAGRTIAAYRDGQGQVIALSLECTHMKCRVRWNGVEASWDCPCHGSRFAPDGQVLEGPAAKPLQRIEL